MDCISFRKNINAYLEGRLDEESLNDFLRHLKGCERCQEELEIHYFVMEGVKILDENKHDCNLVKAYQSSVNAAFRYIRIKKKMLLLRYVIDTFMFWAMAVVIIRFLRLCFMG